MIIIKVLYFGFYIFYNKILLSENIKTSVFNILTISDINISFLVFEEEERQEGTEGRKSWDERKER